MRSDVIPGTSQVRRQWAVSALLCSLVLGLMAPVSAQAPATDKFKLPDGFTAEMIYNVPSDQGSWVSLTTDPQGRLIACDQYGSLYRVTLGDGEPQVETIDIQVGFAQGLLYAFDSLYVMSSGHNAKEPEASIAPGLYRLRDTDGDDQYDELKHLRRIVGRGEHGPHAIVLSPDGQSLYICGGNMTGLPELAASRQPQVWQEDQVIKRYPDGRGHAANVMAPGGWICKIDPEGESAELIASGFRNEYDFAFDPNGELFTYDSDMEWDVGLPWYRPTRVCHAVSGAEFGWRNGSGKWPTYYPDSVPPAVEIGPGSPTGVVFGTGAKFPAKYQRALFICDWSYGVVYAVHLEAQGGTYVGEKERFCTAPALPVTDIVIHPQDGSMYFTIGGRRSQSALYRVRYTGTESTAPADYPALTSLAQQRRALEAGHANPGAVSLDDILAALDSPHRSLRYAARIALEHQPADQWTSRMAAASPQAKLEMVTALVRTTEDSQALAMETLASLNPGQLSPMQQLHLYRNLGLVLCRQGEPSDATRAQIAKLESRFPSGDPLVDRELGKLLVAVGSAPATEKLVQQLRGPASQEAQIGVALTLSTATAGWTLPLREAYFQWFLDIANARGGNSFEGYLNNIRKNAVEGLSESENQALAELLAKEPEKVDPYAELKARPLVKQWTLEDLLPVQDSELANRDLANGKKLFAIATCYKCHRIQGDGGIVGPDLTPAGLRFNTHDLLETIVDPNKAISDQYEATNFLMADGRLVSGRVVNLSGNEYVVQPDMVEPNNLVRINVKEIEEMEPSKVSPMPSGLLDNFTRDEILDLLAYMKSTAEVPPQ